MKTFITLINILVIGLFGLTSCQRSLYFDSIAGQPQPPVSLDSLLQCHTQNGLDSAGIRNSLIGKWNWEYIKCFWAPEKANNTDFKNLSVEFGSNDTLLVRLNNIITQTSSWKLSRTNDGFFTLTTTPLVPQLPGKILLCQNRAIFFDSYVDGCDNYFKKSD
jgi:hypothetical protein